MLVNMSYISRDGELERLQTAEVTFKVIQCIGKGVIR